jgi:hypothetical protein
MNQNPGDFQGEPLESLTGGRAVVGQYLDEMLLTDPFTRGIIFGVVEQKAIAQGVDLSQDEYDVARVNACFIEGLTELLESRTQFQYTDVVENGVTLSTSYYPIRMHLTAKEHGFLGKFIDQDYWHFTVTNFNVPENRQRSLAFIKGENGYTRLDEREWNKFLHAYVQYLRGIYAGIDNMGDSLSMREGQTSHHYYGAYRRQASR